MMKDNLDHLKWLQQSLHDTNEATKAAVEAMAAVAKGQGISRDELFEYHRSVAEHMVELVRDMELELADIGQAQDARTKEHASEIVEMIKQRDAWRGRVEDADNAHILIQKAISLETDKKTLSSEYTKLEAGYEMLESDNKRLMKENSDLRKEVEDGKETAADYKSFLADKKRLMEEKEKLQQSNDKCRMELAECEAVRDRAMTEKAQLAEEHKKLQEKSIDLGAEKNHWQKLCETKEDECNRLKLGMDKVESTRKKSLTRVQNMASAFENQTPLPGPPSLPVAGPSEPDEARVRPQDGIIHLGQYHVHMKETLAFTTAVISTALALALVAQDRNGVKQAYTHNLAMYCSEILHRVKSQCPDESLRMLDSKWPPKWLDVDDKAEHQAWVNFCTSAGQGRAGRILQSNEAGKKLKASIEKRLQFCAGRDGKWSGGFENVLIGDPRLDGITDKGEPRV
ncbi:hypothetical protein ACEQ8H_008395 [Pleosporales sp. CAS-2024a]